MGAISDIVRSARASTIYPDRRTPLSVPVAGQRVSSRTGRAGGWTGGAVCGHLAHVDHPLSDEDRQRLRNFLRGETDGWEWVNGGRFGLPLQILRQLTPSPEDGSYP